MRFTMRVLHVVVWMALIATAQSVLALDDPMAVANYSRPYSPWLALVVIAISGGFGGFVDGLRATRTYNFRFRTFTQDWGSAGDALVGMAAAVAIFAFADSIF